MRGAFSIVVLVALAGAARAEDNPACAKYQEPLAYNACLAKLGPRTGVTHSSSAPTMGAPSRTRGLLSMTRGRRGRVQAVFSIK